jgi:hypothetical protein
MPPFHDIASPLPSTPLATIMAIQRGQGKAKELVDLEAEERREEMAVLRRKNIIFAPVLKQEDLVQRYSFMWGRETTAHPVPQVLPGSAK